MSENFPTFEFSNFEQELILKLGAVSPDSSEARELMNAWFDEMEKLAQGDKSPRASIELNLRHAKICRAAGYTDEAWESLESLRRLATELNLMDFYGEAMSIMDEIDEEK